MEDNATIIDTKQMIEKLENNEKLDRLKNAKKLNKIANLQIEDEIGKKKNPFEGLKIPRRSLKKKPTKRKKLVTDFEKLTVNEYTYDEFSKAVNFALPHIINYSSFKDDAFLKKLKKSKDIQHFSDTQILFPITNDYLGFAGAVLGCAVEYYAEKKLSVSVDKDIEKEKHEKAEQKGKRKKKNIQIADELFDVIEDSTNFEEDTKDELKDHVVKSFGLSDKKILD